MQLDGVIQERIQTYEWQCLECKQCEICGRTEDLEVSLPAAPRLSLEQELTFSRATETLSRNVSSSATNVTGATIPIA
jgi:hypothetical protein